MNSKPSRTAATSQAHRLRPLPSIIFASRWLQLPLYLGLIVAQAVYVFHFWVELVHLIEAAFGSTQAVATIASAVQPCDPEAAKIANRVCAAVPTKLTETLIMLLVLGLIDVVMISNLLIMVIVGGYETFVSRMDLESHPDQPEWLSHVNASVLKVKLATAIIGISSIHLLKTFINAEQYTEKTLIAQTVIHVVFLLSAMAIALTDRLMSHASGAKH
ncbi:MAG: YqhA family protein [Burkholderiales bacterium]|nr:YqhA family protein [Burkholderiales bacterium]